MARKLQSHLTKETKLRLWHEAGGDRDIYEALKIEFCQKMMDKLRGATNGTRQN